MNQNIMNIYTGGISHKCHYHSMKTEMIQNIMNIYTALVIHISVTINSRECYLTTSSQFSQNSSYILPGTLRTESHRIHGLVLQYMLCVAIYHTHRTAPKEHLLWDLGKSTSHSSWCFAPLQQEAYP